MDGQVPRAQDAQERPTSMDGQVLRAQDAQERPTSMDGQVLRAQDAQERPQTGYGAATVRPRRSDDANQMKFP